MIVDTLVCLLLVLGVAFGLSRPVVDRLELTPSEGLVAGVALSLIGAWLVAWTVFTSGSPLREYGLLPVLAVSGIVLGRRGVARLAADPAARNLAVGQLLVTAWCAAWLSFIRNHSGGAWIGDWVEHWQRTHFFLREWPADKPFFDIYQMPARPPLANVLTAAFLQLTRADYAHYQLVMTALCSLAYLPVGLLAARLGGPRAARLAAVILLVNPLFIQNATYPWTKLPAVFFILTGLYFFLRLRDRGPGERTAAVLCALCLGGAVVTHYSAGPYVVVLAAAWVAIGRRSRWSGGFAGLTFLSAAAGACVLAPWFLWSAAHYGWNGTLLSNSSVSMMQKAPGNPLVIMILNLRDSLIPPQLRGFSGTLFAQSSRWGALRDQVFLIYQLNPLLALGCVGWLAVVVEGIRSGRAAARPERGFWICALAGFVILSFAAYGDRDHYGTGHICLQSVVLLGLAFLASRWDRMGTRWKAALIAGWAVDFCMGIALQFAVEDFALDRWFDPTLTLPQISRTYGIVSQENLREKIIAQLSYFADILPTPPALVLALLGAILCMALLRARPMPGESRQP